VVSSGLKRPKPKMPTRMPSSDLQPRPNSLIGNGDFQVDELPDGAIFRLSRPAKLNAITKPILAGLAALLDSLEARGARLLIITGTGSKAFCAGTDLAETALSPKPDRLEKSAMARALFVRLSRSNVLSVAALNGLAFGGGLELAMACTLRIATEKVTVSLPEIKLGLLPAYGGTQFLPALIGKSRALEMMLTGRVVNAPEALAIGLIHRMVSGNALITDDALNFAREVTQFSQPAIDGIKRCVASADIEVTEAGLEVEDQVVREVFTSDDAEEGVAAFLQKRAPRFTHR
jgi:enoyl-CoA hydratase